ncbi:MAG: hypothetical protein Q7T16_05210 [Candidatus Burarchaeum sp.]|nr:hypothetical protein [Candidatus Burarchaeum sp.]MDO8340028.1 hypothetical protein [Candidatus Burarchaeum sp.]
MGFAGIGDDVSFSDNGPERELYKAIYRKDLGMIRSILVNKQVDPNSTTAHGLDEGWTYLMLVCSQISDKNASYKMAELFLEAGADPNKKNSCNHSAKSMAELGKRADLVTLINTHPFMRLLERIDPMLTNMAKQLMRPRGVKQIGNPIARATR